MAPNLQTILQEHFIPRCCTKGTTLVRQGEVCGEIYFVEKGLLKVMSMNGDREFVLRFFPENAFVTIVDSFTEQKPSHFRLVALEDSELLVINHNAFEALCAESHAVANLFRKINQWVAAAMMKRIQEVLANDAAQQYAKFLEEQAAIVQRISLGELAKYIGVTQVSLSRIRAQK